MDVCVANGTDLRNGFYLTGQDPLKAHDPELAEPVVRQAFPTVNFAAKEARIKHDIQEMEKEVKQTEELMEQIDEWRTFLDNLRGYLN